MPILLSKKPTKLRGVIKSKKWADVVYGWPLMNFVSPNMKLHSRYCHNVYIDVNLSGCYFYVFLEIWCAIEPRFKGAFPGQR